jgi:dTDP-4-amino-4,6-dideoxygalactose transaminase
MTHPSRNETSNQSREEAAQNKVKPQVSADLGTFPSWPPDWSEIGEAIAKAVSCGDWGRYRGESYAELIRRISEFAATKHVRLVGSGSIAIELALRGLGVSQKDQVVLCGYDYPGNFRAIELMGARPVLVDVDRTSYSIDPNELERVSSQSVVAVLVSHLYGVPAQIKAIREICDRRGWMLVEDACQTPGMTIQGMPAGSWGDVGVFSFGGSKPLTAGNGGAILTRDNAVATRLGAYLDRPSDSIPLSELQAAALLPQLDRLDQCNQIRGETIQSILQEVPWMVDGVGERRPGDQSTCYKLAFESESRDTESRDAVLASLSQLGLPVGPGYRSMHRSSDRRCGKIGPLDRCRTLDDQLCLLDHSVLLSVGDTRQRLIEVLASCRPG